MSLAVPACRWLHRRGRIARVPHVELDRTAGAQRDATNDANDFAILFDTMMDRAYSYKLWGAAYVIHGGCDNDTLDDFRSSLISRGRSYFERAIADPDSLADEPFDETWF
jgi:hypothetical protein